MNEIKYLFKIYNTKNKCLIKNNNKKIIIYGAGYCGLLIMRLLQDINIKPISFIDSNESKQGKNLDGIPVMAPIMDNKICPEDALVLVCLFSKENYKNIKINLVNSGFKYVQHILKYKWDKELFKNQLLMISPNFDLFRKNTKNIQKVYNMLEDKESRSTLKDILKFVLMDNHINLINLPIREQYFAYDIFKHSEDEVFFDCGAHSGYVMDVFLQKNNMCFQKYICYEPDPINVEEIVQKKSGYSKEIANKIEIHNVALSDGKEKVYLKNFNHMNSVIVSDGDIEADTILLDEHIDKFVPTFIKIDVEGFEMKLLAGAMQMIKRYQPIVAVAIYHKESDLWQIPFFLKRILPNHKFFIRSYMNYMETILYAVPVKRVR